MLLNLLLANISIFLCLSLLFFIVLKNNLTNPLHLMKNKVINIVTSPISKPIAEANNVFLDFH